MPQPFMAPFFLLDVRFAGMVFPFSLVFRDTGIALFLLGCTTGFIPALLAGSTFLAWFAGLLASSPALADVVKQVGLLLFHDFRNGSVSC